nr:S-layer homology domain-containing protein [Butyricicoccus sp. AF22-28AC]
MKRRLLSAFLAVMMVLTMAPVAFAADEGDTLQSKINNASDTVTLTQNYAEDITIPAGKNITLDLNGKTLTNKTGHTITVEQGATLTINGEGTVDNVTHAKSALVNYGEVVLDNGVTLERSSEAGTLNPYSNGGNSYYTILNDKGATMTINDATVKNNGGFSSAIRNGGDENCNDESHLTIKDGNFSGGLNAVKNDECGILTINGGTFSNTSQYVIMNWNKATINNGTFSVKDSADAVLFTAAYHENRAVGELIVNNGTFTGNGSQKMVENHYGSSYTGTASITGGTFSSDVSAYVAEGYVQNEKGTVEQLGATNAVAKIGDTYYKTLADAYAALPRNAGTDSEPTTITVLKDSEGKAIGSDSDKGMNYVIDFGGHTYTVGKPAVGSTGTETQGLRVLKGSKAVFKNGTLKAVNYPDMKMPVHTYGDVTFEDFTVDATEDSYAQIAYEIDNGSLNMLGNSSILAYPGKIGLYVSFWPRGGYTDGTTVNIDTTGKITGKMVYEWDDKADTAEQQKENKAVLNIKNGNFDITNIQTLFTSSLPSNLKVPKIYISGGYFTVDPSAYCVTGKTGVPSNRTDEYAWTVGKKSETKAEVATGEPTVDTSNVTTNNAADKELLEDTKNALSSTKVEGNGIATAAAVAANNNTVKADEAVVNKLNAVAGNTTATAENTNIVIQTYMDMTITGVDASSEKKTITVDIQPMYRTVATTADVKNGGEIVLKGDESKAVNAVQIGNPQKLAVSGETTVSIQLPTGFVTDATAKIFVQHKGYEYEATVTKDDGVYTATFTNPHGFSPFTISMTSQAVAQIGETKYTSLQDAVNAVENNGTIEIVGGTSPYTGTANKTFTVSNKTNAEITVNGQKIAKDKSYTFKYTPSSGSSSGGSSSGKTTYKVTTSAVNNGGVNASPSSAEKGATITITLSPDKGYKLDKLTVTDGSGKTVSTVKKSDTVYTFTMPASAVKVGVSYVKATETPSETKFNDVSANDWFASAVDYVTGKGMMNGTADNTFSPKANTTRGMVVTVLYRLENQPSTSAASFTDVASGAYYANAVAWANANGIVSGYGSGKFGPNDKVTREQLAAILYRYAQYKKYDVSVGEDTNILSYDDAQSISSYAIPAIQWACGAGVVTGKSGSKLDPKGNATRAEVAAMLMRFCENVK